MPELPTSPLAREAGVLLRPTPLGYVAGALLAASGVLLFALEQRPIGWVVLAAAVLAAFAAQRRLGRDMVLIAIGLVVMSLVPVTPDISIGHMLLMGSAMIIAIAVPYLISRYGYREHAIRFPVRTGQPWTRVEKIWLGLVVVLGYLLLPVYMIRTGVYENWPDASGDPAAVARLFVGVNGLGIWDELFFVCTAFALLRRYFPDWQAIILQAVLFTSFLYELGFRSIGPLLIFPFALIQGYTFKLTRSLTYIVCVHLLFDFVLFLVLLHAHDRSLVPIFIY